MTLEDMDILFGTIDELQRRADVEHALYKRSLSRGGRGE